jgi:PAS domain S-box-containing protein
MKNAFQTRILAVVLAAATLAVCVLAGLNMVQESSYQEPTDGVWWVEAAGGLCAQHVPADSPGQKAGIRTGDVLQQIDGIPTPRLAPFVRQTFRDGIFSSAEYTIARNAKPCIVTSESAILDIKPVYLEATDRSINQGLRLIAVVYLIIGLYVLFRRWTAPKSTHFFVFCLVSFVLYAFKFTGQFDTLDQIVYWSNVVATALQPALFLHFAVSFSASTDIRRILRRRIIVAALYMPALYLVGLQYTAIQYWSATELLKHRLDKIALAYMAIYYVAAAILFFLRASRTESTLERQQLKWLTRGTLVAVVPFTFLYVFPFLFDLAVPTLFTNIVRLSLVVLPLTFSWAIVRYRLMDVDLIFKRGVTYTLATAALAGIYFTIVAVAAEIVHTRYQSFGTWGLLIAIVVTAIVFDPLKRAIQARVDRIFDQKRFDYRETLVDFGRSLNSQTDLRALVDSIVERLPQTLLVTRVAVFLADEEELHLTRQYELAASHGLTNLVASELEGLDLAFMDFDAPDANTHIFLENPQQALALPDAQRHAAARLDLNYYLPCRVANRHGVGTRTVAVIGLGRTTGGDFLSSEDMEVLESLAGYIGIAIQNAQLYRRLEQKINDFERLTEFNQNIVESIDIGILAVDLDDHIESWNARMEVMFARSRGEALRCPLSDVFPPEFLARFNSVRNEPGTHTLYKFRLTLPMGEVRIANIAIAPLVTKNFQTIGRIILVDDITDRIELEAQLTQSEKLSSIGLLAAGVAHEVNTPLAVISSYTQMLTKQLRANEEMSTRLTPVLEKITQQTFRASEIVNGLLNFSRTSGAEFTAIDLNQLLRDSCILLEHQFKTARIRIEQDLAPLPLIQGNQGKLQQVILNLLLNAKEAMQGIDSGALKIATLHEAKSAVVLIQDHGSGIEREHLHRIFDPFFTTKTNPQPGQHKGTGLGLAVTYGILQEHGGKISVESHVGTGTTFRLEFPAAAAAPTTSIGTTVGAS